MTHVVQQSGVARASQTSKPYEPDAAIRRLHVDSVGEPAADTGAEPEEPAAELTEPDTESIAVSLSGGSPPEIPPDRADDEPTERQNLRGAFELSPATADSARHRSSDEEEWPRGRHLDQVAQVALRRQTRPEAEELQVQANPVVLPLLRMVHVTEEIEPTKPTRVLPKDVPSANSIEGGIRNHIAQNNPGAAQTDQGTDFAGDENAEKMNSIDGEVLNSPQMISSSLPGRGVIGRVPDEAEDSDTAGVKEIFNKGQDLYTEGKYLQAADNFKKAYELSPMPEFLFNAGAAYEMAKDYGKSIEQFNRYLGTDPSSGDKGLVLKRLADMATAAKVDGLVKARIFYDYGDWLFQTGTYLEAAESFKKAYEAHAFTKFLFNIGACFEKGKNYSEAIKYYERYVEQKPDDADKALRRIEMLKSEVASD